MGKLFTIAAILSAPPTIAHEATHYAVARTVTDDAHFAVEVTTGGAVARWRPIDSALMRFLAFLAPTIFGLLLTGIWLAAGVEVDGWRLLLAIGLAIYTFPSRADLRGAVGRQAVQQRQ